MPTERENPDQGPWEPRDPSEQENSERIRQMLELANWFFGQANDRQRSGNLKHTLLNQSNTSLQRATLSDITRLRKDPTDLNYKFVPKGIEYGEWLWSQSSDGNHAWAVRHESPLEYSDVLLTSRFFDGISREQRDMSSWEIRKAIAPVHLKKSTVPNCYYMLYPGRMELYTQAEAQSIQARRQGR